MAVNNRANQSGNVGGPFLQLDRQAGVFHLNVCEALNEIDRMSIHIFQDALRHPGRTGGQRNSLYQVLSSPCAMSGGMFKTRTDENALFLKFANFIARKTLTWKHLMILVGFLF